MDSIEEDVSARVLLRNVLHTEISRTPVTRSTSRNQQVQEQVKASHQRRSSRVRNVPAQESPQLALRNKLKQKLHETATRSPVPPSKRRRSQARTVKTPAVASSSLYNEDVTPRGLLRGIIQTEAEASLLLSGQPMLLEPEKQHAETSIYNNRLSEGTSGLELPDLATEPLSHVIRGLRRKQPLHTVNVSAFERQLYQQNQSGDGEKSDVTEENTEVTQEQDLTLASKSVLSLTLKTPFVHVQAERVGLQRKAGGRRKPSVDAFDEAVQKRLERHQNREYTTVHEGRTHEDSEWHKFTLGLSNVTVPELTTDIAMSNTELYAQPAASMSHLKDIGGIAETDICETEKEDERERETDDAGEKETDEHPDDECLRETAQTESGQETEEPGTCLKPQEDMGAMELSQAEESVGLSVDEIPFAPTQAMVEPSSQTWMVERLEIMCLPSELQSFTGDSGPDELPHVEDKSYPATMSTSASPTLNSFSPLEHQTSLAEMEEDGNEEEEEEEAVDEGQTIQSKDENIVNSQVHLSTTPQSPAAVEEEEDQQQQAEEEEEEEEDTQSEELSMQTPSFIRKRKDVATPKALAPPTVLKSLNTGPVPKVKGPRSKQISQSVSEGVLSKSYVMSVFKHFAKTKVANDVYPVINEILQKYFDRLADDLEAYSAHAKRKTIEVEDVELLMRRQGFVTDTTPINVLIEKFLPLEYRKLLIPVATSGNKVVPNQRR